MLQNAPSKIFANTMLPSTMLSQTWSQH